MDTTPSPAPTATESAADTAPTAPLTPPPLAPKGPSLLPVWGAFAVLVLLSGAGQMQAHRHGQDLAAQLAQATQDLAQLKQSTSTVLDALRTEQAHLRAQLGQQAASAEAVARMDATLASLHEKNTTTDTTLAETAARLEALEAANAAQATALDAALSKAAKTSAAMEKKAAKPPMNPAPSAPSEADRLASLQAILATLPAPVAASDAPSSIVATLNSKLGGLFYLRKKTSQTISDPYAQIRTLSLNPNPSLPAMEAALRALPSDAQAPFASWLKISAQPTVAKGE